MDTNYLERSGATLIMQSMVQLNAVGPPKPTEFMVQFLQDNYNIEKKNNKRSAPDYDSDDSNDSNDSDAGNQYESMHTEEAEHERGCESPYLVVPESLKRRRRGAICCDVPNSIDYDIKKEIYPKNAETCAMLEKSLAKNIMFAHLEAGQLSQVFSAMFEVKFVAGEVVYRQGDDGDKFYSLQSGECEVLALKSGTLKPVAMYEKGSSFGELALIYDSPRTSTVRARTDIVLWAIDRLSFQSIVMETTKRTQTLYEAILEKVPILAHLTKAERSTVADSLITEQFWDGDVIVNQGDNGEKFYIIVEGSIQISKFGQAIGTMETSQYFGEIALLTNRPRAATIIAVGNTKCVCLDRGSFNRLLGPIEDILLRNMGLYDLSISN